MQGLRTTRQGARAWRVHVNPTALPNLPVEGETPPNRYDDPQREYRVRYFATNKRGAFLEVLARFRRNDETQKRLGAVAEVDERAEPGTSAGRVPPAFLIALKEVAGQVADPEHYFIDVTAEDTLTALGEHPRIRRALDALSSGESGHAPRLDKTTIRLPPPQGNTITQPVSRVVYDETDAVGIHYASRLDELEPCWAVFDWVTVDFSETKPIDANDDALKSAAAAMMLTLP